ncbi:MAG: AsnC family protein [Cenarchaeum sp. SB0663_bin_5]|nr:AsnC family protein [Cenarchaeum sp. SB0663_bin_5]MYH04166.1 AsnC family protein [Cenarchaeum sp. SB0675_bin_21]
MHDDLDRRLLHELYQDGSISVPVLSKKIGANPSVLYSRIKHLLCSSNLWNGFMVLFLAGYVLRLS